MAHHKSALKRIKIAARNQERNRYYRTTMRTSIKRVLTAENKDEAITRYNNAASILDKLVSKGIIHRNMAANKKSTLMKHVNSLT
ncbi:MAG: 30S ribosomal protein S20 [Calditrichia bacterium]